MDNKTIKSKIGWTIIILIVSLFPASLIYLSIIGPGDRDKVEREVLAPYFTTLNEGKYREAWEKYTTDHYKKKFPFEVYETHYKKIFGEYGKIVRRTVVAARRGYNPFSKAKTFTVDYVLTFEKGHIRLNFSLISKADDHYLIENGAAGSTSVLYYRRGYPW